VSLKRIAIAVVLLACCIWTAWVWNALKDIDDALPALRTFELSAVEIPTESISVTASTAEVPPEIQRSADESLPDAVAAVDSPTETVVNFPQGEILYPITAESRCLIRDVWGNYLGESVKWTRFSSVVPYYDVSDRELQAMADSGDGYAQFLYAFNRVLGIGDIYDTEATPDEVLEHLESTDDEALETAMPYFVKSIRNHNWIAADQLASIFYPFDRVEARAWAVIGQMAGGKSLEKRESGRLPDEVYDFTDAEVRESEARAEELIAEFDLNPGLSPPEQCR